MKLLSFTRPNGSAGFGLVVDSSSVIDLSQRLPEIPDLRALLTRADWQDLAARHQSATPDFKLEEIRFLPVIPNPDKILCVGINYASHVIETGREMPTKPMIFTRFANTQTGHGEAMVRPLVSERFDFEGELAVIIGKPVRYATRENALESVAGYSCYNDGSIRDWQRHSGQFTPGKNFPATGAFGPWMATPDEMGELSKQRLVTRLNGEVMQDATFDDLIFDIPAIISYCSSFAQLEPGDVIITGTTGGVGAFRQPPVWLKAGDTVEVEISGIGILRNPVVDENAALKPNLEWN